MQPSCQVLIHLGIWANLDKKINPLWRLHIIDQTDNLVKAPSVKFNASELGAAPFAWNIPHDDLVRELKKYCKSTGQVEFISGPPVSGLENIIMEDAPYVQITKEDETEHLARVVIAADGAQSFCRRFLGIGTSDWKYDQVALACSFSHSLPHNDTSIEFHHNCGPLTTVPLPGKRSSLVWVERPARARELMSMQPEKFEQVLQSSLNDVLGDIKNVSARGAFPLQGLTARQFAKDRIMLVGEAAHVIPPIGAQGLNLGFRDAAFAAQFIDEAHADKADIGSPDVLKKYEMSRRSDVVSRTLAVDALNRSLGSSFLPLQGLRGVGLFMLKNVASIRKAAMRRGMASGENLPLLMRDA